MCFSPNPGTTTCPFRILLPLHILSSAPKCLFSLFSSIFIFSKLHMTSSNTTFYHSCFVGFQLLFMLLQWNIYIFHMVICHISCSYRALFFSKLQLCAPTASFPAVIILIFTLQLKHNIASPAGTCCLLHSPFFDPRLLFLSPVQNHASSLRAICLLCCLYVTIPAITYTVSAHLRQL